ncbi:MoxR-like ATPase [Methylophaga frappieri]|jgi:MoxR-like ATPase|uniref:MoxR-like ATPase n=1 Tax=Methylophaga frappieri (strain ATCC BAA-2434 / DSM 25690 / JAM7) TaxID=754477 RepID=I1YK14_METFJ|nr:MoxR family ATPase [Methylophaga frappieri]AFJ03257.1 MoxR-like ATPase [Methylophaga frappieri]
MNRTTPSHETQLSDWQKHAQAFKETIQSTVIGQDDVIHLLTVAVFCRGHVLLEGDVGVGKTTLLRSAAECIGGDFERIEGTIDLMPHDLVYYTHIDQNGKPAVSPGPLLKHGDKLSIFFFNEINRARPQMHSLLLRVMAERSVSAFNKPYYFPHLQVFADRNRIEKDETFELPAAARDRFMMELLVRRPESEQQLKSLMFDTRYYDADKLVANTTRAVLPYEELNDFAAVIQSSVQTSDALQHYGYQLCEALRSPANFGISIADTDTKNLIQGGMGPRGMIYLAQASRAQAWLSGRDYVIPEDFHVVLTAIAKHRIFLNPVYKHQQDTLINELITAVLNAVACP